MRSGSKRWVATMVVALGVTVAIAGCSGDSTTTTAGGPTTSTTLAEGAGATSTTGDSGTTITTAPGGATVTNTTTFVLGGKSREEYEDSIPGLEQKVESAPTDLVALQELAIAQYQTERYAEAAATYDAMLAVGDDAMTRNNKGNVLRDWGKLSEARKEYEKAIQLDPALTVAYVNLSALHLRLQETDKAIAVLDSGIAKTTGDDQQRLKDIKADLIKSAETT